MWISTFNMLCYYNTIPLLFKKIYQRYVPPCMVKFSIHDVGIHTMNKTRVTIITIYLVYGGEKTIKATKTTIACMSLKDFFFREMIFFHVDSILCTRLFGQPCFKLFWKKSAVLIWENWTDFNFTRQEKEMKGCVSLK